jgi:hypothetical protein
VLDDLYDNYENPAEAIPVMNYQAKGEPFLIDGLVHEAATVLYGRPEAGKSYYALSAADAITKGEPTWLNHKVHQHGQVLFMGLDPGQQSQTRRRVDKIPDGSDFLISTARPAGGDRAEGWWLALAQWCERKGIALLIIDNLTRIMPPGKSWRNDEHVAPVLARLDRIIERGTAVLLLHHAGKPGEDGKPTTSPVGSTAIEAWARHLIRVERDRDKRSRKATLHVVGNDEEAFELRTLHYPNGAGNAGPFFDVLGEDRTSHDAEATNGTALAHHVLQVEHVFTSMTQAARWLKDNTPAGFEPTSVDGWKKRLKRLCFDRGYLTGGGQAGAPLMAGPNLGTSP